MNLKSLDRKQILEKPTLSSPEERRITKEVLLHLREIERRLLFAELGYPSLFEMCIREFRYSEGAAARRISAMRALTEIPELEEKLEAGELSLSVVSTVQTFIKHEEKKLHKKYTLQEKRELFTQMEGKSRRECERVLTAISPESLLPQAERVRPLSETYSEIRMTLSQELIKKLKRIRDLTSHRNPHPSYAELLELLADDFLKRNDPGLKAERAKGKPGSEQSSKPNTQPSLEQHSEPISKSELATRSSNHLTQPLPFTPPAECMKAQATTRPQRSIPSAIKQQVWKRDQGQCTYRDTQSGRRCLSTRFLQFEHCQPLGLGGESTPENLTLLCQAHNRLRAIQVYGWAKVARESGR